jgi:hypothetical protein
MDLRDSAVAATKILTDSGAGNHSSDDSALASTGYLNPGVGYNDRYTRSNAA